MIHVAGVIRRHLENVLNYISHRITNGVTEGLNAKIQWIKFSSRGFRDRERFKLVIYFHCGGLDLRRSCAPMLPAQRFCGSTLIP
jgi:transposase